MSGKDGGHPRCFPSLQEARYGSPDRLPLPQALHQEAAKTAVSALGDDCDVEHLKLAGKKPARGKNRPAPRKIPAAHQDQNRLVVARDAVSQSILRP